MALRVISLNSVAFGVHYVKVVEDTPYFLWQKCSQKYLVLAISLLMAIFAEVTEKECVILRRCTSHRIPSVRPSVRLFVTFRCFVQTNEHTIMRFTALGMDNHSVGSN